MEDIRNKIIIDCDRPPEIPNEWTIKSHKKLGQFEWDESRIGLYLSDRQRTGGLYTRFLLEELKNQNVLNANVLDFLLENEDLIRFAPYNSVIFWGTIYENSLGQNFVRFLEYDNKNWRSNYFDLWRGVGKDGKWVQGEVEDDHLWHSWQPAAILLETK